MIKRDFLKSLAMAMAGAASGALGTTPLAGETPRRRPKNWVWISKDGSRTEDDWHRVFEDLHRRGIEAVAVEMYDGRHAYWDSRSVPVKEERLDTILRVSRRHAIEVHAWVRPQDVPAERLRTIVAELADVPTLIGVHLDVADVGGPCAGPEAACRALTAVVTEKLVPAARTRGTLLTAAVPAAAEQIWRRWPLDGFLAIIGDPAGPDAVTSVTRAAVDAVSTPVYCGLVAGTLGPDALAAAARAALAGGAAGVSLFDLASMDEMRWAAFEQAVTLG